MVISSDNDNGGAVVTEAVMVALFVGLAVVCVDCETWEGALLLLSIVEIVFFLLLWQLRLLLSPRSLCTRFSFFCCFASNDVKH